MVELSNLLPDPKERDWHAQRSEERAQPRTVLGLGAGEADAMTEVPILHFADVEDLVAIPLAPLIG